MPCSHVLLGASSLVIIISEEQVVLSCYYTLQTFCFLKLTFDIRSSTYHITSIMSQRRHRSRSTSAERMENDLNRSINKSFRESPAEVTRSSRADSCGPSQGTSTQPKKAIPVQVRPTIETLLRQGPSRPIKRGRQGGPASTNGVARTFVTSRTELIMGATRLPSIIRRWLTTMRLPLGWNMSTNGYSGSPQGRTATGTLAAVLAPEFGGNNPPVLPWTVDQERETPRTHALKTS
jgi:hypothetical protein